MGPGDYRPSLDELIGPAPGAQCRLQLHDVALEPDGALHFNSQSTKAFLNQMLSLPARISTTLSIELAPPLTTNGTSAPAHPIAQLTTLVVEYPSEDLDGSLGLHNLRSRLYLGSIGSLAVPSSDSAAISSVHFEFKHWRRRGGGADGRDPVYTLCLGFGAPKLNEAPMSPVSDVPISLTSLAPTEPDEDAEDEVIKPVEDSATAAAEFLGALAPLQAEGGGVLQPVAALGLAEDEEERRNGGTRDGYERRSRSRSRSRSRDRYWLRQRSYSRSPGRRERSWDQSPARGRSHSGMPAPEVDVHRAQAPHPGAWAAGYAMPSTVDCLQRPKHGARTVFAQRLTSPKVRFDNSTQISPAGKMLWAALGLPRESVPHTVRVVMVVPDSNGSFVKILPTCFLKCGMLLRWRELVEAVGDVTEGHYMVFTFLGTLRMADPEFKDPEVPFFAVRTQKKNPCKYKGKHKK